MRVATSPSVPCRTTFGSEYSSYSPSFHIKLWNLSVMRFNEIFPCRKCDVVNRGFSGYNAKWLKILLPQLFTKSDFDALAGFVLCLGANDSVLPESPQHVSLTEFSSNISAILDELIVGSSYAFHYWIVSNTELMFCSQWDCRRKNW